MAGLRKVSKKLFRLTLPQILLLLLIPLFCQTPGDVAAADPPEVLRVAFLPNVSQMEIVKTFGPFIKALEAATHMRIEVSSGKDYTEIIEKFRDKRIDIGMLGGFAYVSAQDDFGVKLFVRNLEAKGDAPANDAYHSLIVTRKNSGINTLAELKGKRFAFTDPKSTSGFLFPLVGLMNHGIHLDDLKSVVYVNKHPNSLLAVYHGQVDASALAEDHYSGATGVNLDEMTVLWKSDPIHYGAWVARSDMPDSQVRMIKSAFLDISHQKDASAIFSQSYIKGFVPAQDADYDNVRQALKVQAALKTQ